MARAQVSVLPANRRDHLLMSVGLIAWLVYTRFLPVLSAVHMTLPPCPFYALTGHPCPFCGGTRSYAAMWHGDLAASARYYPLGPALFVLTFGAVAYTAWVAARGRQVGLPAHWLRALGIVGGLVLAVSWSLKLFWLGN